MNLPKRWRAEDVKEALREFETDLLPGERIVLQTTELCGCGGERKCQACRGTGYLFDALTLWASVD